MEEERRGDDKGEDTKGGDRLEATLYQLEGENKKEGDKEEECFPICSACEKGFNFFYRRFIHVWSNSFFV